MSAAAFPTGAQLLGEIERAAIARGVPPQTLAKQLSPYPTNWLRQLGSAAHPKPNTVDHVRAVIAGERPPAPDLTNRPATALLAKTRLQEAMLKLLTKAADESKECPTNPELTKALNFKTATSARDLIKSLEMQGLIVVRRFSRSRQVTIVSSGRSTVAWEDAPASQASTGIGHPPDAAASLVMEVERPAATARPAIDNDPRPFAWSRDPCPLCAVRGDLGCSHQQPFQPMTARGSR